MKKKEIEQFLGGELAGDEYKSLIETGYVQELLNVLGIAETATLDPGSNPPDCSVLHGERRIGIEHTRLIEPEVKKAQSAFDQGKNVPGFNPKIDEPDFQKPIWVISEANVESVLVPLVRKKCQAAVSWKKVKSTTFAGC